MDSVLHKQKLCIYDQIQHMKRKGIKFNVISEEEAVEYITNNTYCFKIKAFANI